MISLSTCIIKKIHKDYIIIYSYLTGLYYMVKCNQIIFEYKGDKIYYITKNELEVIEKIAVNPNNIDIRIFTSPIVMSLMVSNVCNLKCKYCISRNANSYSKNNILLDDMEFLKNVLLSSKCVGLIFSGGEPTLAPNLCIALKKIPKEQFLYELDTNGIMITDDLIEIIKEKKIVPRISLDAINESVHNSSRGMYNIVMANILKLIDLRIDFRINTVLYNNNKVDIFNLAEWIKEHKIRKWHIFKLRTLYAPKEMWIDDAETEIIVNSLELRYSNDIDIICKFSEKNDGFSSFIIDGEGNCFSSKGKEKVIFGNIFEKNLAEIWLSSPLKFRQAHFNKFLYYDGKKF